MVFPKKSHWDMIFLLPSGKMAFLFPENTIFFLRTENERCSFSKNTWKYDVFYMFGKDGVSFSYKYEMTLLLKKAKMIFSRKIYLKMTFLALLKKMIFILEKVILTF